MLRRFKSKLSRIPETPAERLRKKLIRVALEWQKSFGVAPQITSAISELDAARLVGMPEDEYCTYCQPRTAVSRGHDFEHDSVRYQVTANRPSGKKGSPVTKVSLKQQFEWDVLIWLLYDREYMLQEAWAFNVEDYRQRFSGLKRLHPDHMRTGSRLWPKKRAPRVQP